MEPDNQRINIYILHDDRQVPNPAVTSRGKWGNIFLPKEMIPIWLDLVRNGKPLFGYIKTEIPKLTNISTSQEPVGEDESEIRTPRKFKLINS